MSSGNNDGRPRRSRRLETLANNNESSNNSNHNNNDDVDDVVRQQGQPARGKHSENCLYRQEGQSLEAYHDNLRRLFEWLSHYHESEFIFKYFRKYPYDKNASNKIFRSVCVACNRDGFDLREILQEYALTNRKEKSRQQCKAWANLNKFFFRVVRNGSVIDIEETFTDKNDNARLLKSLPSALVKFLLVWAFEDLQRRQPNNLHDCVVRALKDVKPNAGNFGENKTLPGEVDRIMNHLTQQSEEQDDEGNPMWDASKRRMLTILKVTLDGRRFLQKHRLQMRRRKAGGTTPLDLPNQQERVYLEWVGFATVLHRHMRRFHQRMEAARALQRVARRYIQEQLAARQQVALQQQLPIQQAAELGDNEYEFDNGGDDVLSAQLDDDNDDDDIVDEAERLAAADVHEGFVRPARMLVQERQQVVRQDQPVPQPEYSPTNTKTSVSNTNINNVVVSHGSLEQRGQNDDEDKTMEAAGLFLQPPVEVRAEEAGGMNVASKSCEEEEESPDNVAETVQSQLDHALGKLMAITSTMGSAADDKCLSDCAQYVETMLIQHQERNGWPAFHDPTNFEGMDGYRRLLFLVTDMEEQFQEDSYEELAVASNLMKVRNCYLYMKERLKGTTNDSLSGGRL